MRVCVPSESRVGRAAPTDHQGAGRQAQVIDKTFVQEIAEQIVAGDDAP